MKATGENKKLGIKEGFVSGFGGGVIASLCCIGPLIVILLGLGTLSFALSVSQYKPYFLILGFLSMTSAIIMHLRKKSKTCDINCFSVEGLKREKYFIGSVALTMMLVYVLALYVLVPAISPAVYASAVDHQTNDRDSVDPGGGQAASGVLRQLELKISDITCTGCALGIEYGFKELPGVVKAQVNPDGTAYIIYNPAKVTKEEVLAASDVYPTIIVGDTQVTEEIETNEDKEGDTEQVLDTDVHEFSIEAYQWGFEPSTIRVHKNGRVVLYLTSRDVVHGFAIPEYDLVARIEPGKTTPISFVTDKVGEFSFYCSIPCGSGHSQMIGRLIVE